MINEADISKEMKEMLKEPLTALHAVRSMRSNTDVKLENQLSNKSNEVNFNLTNKDYYNILLSTFSRVSSCYKFLWLYGILQLVKKGKTSFSYNDVVNEMIKIGLNLAKHDVNIGPGSVTLNNIIQYLLEDSFREINIDVVLNVDENIQKAKKQMCVYVPYHFQSVMLFDSYDISLTKSPNSLIKIFNGQKNVIYRYSNFDYLNTNITLDDDWHEYFADNNGLLLDFVKYKLTKYLNAWNSKIIDL